MISMFAFSPFLVSLTIVFKIFNISILDALFVANSSGTVIRILISFPARTVIDPSPDAAGTAPTLSSWTPGLVTDLGRLMKTVRLFVVSCSVKGIRVFLGIVYLQSLFSSHHQDIRGKCKYRLLGFLEGR